MKRMKKLFALLLTLAMVMGMTVTANAADGGTDGIIGTADDTGVITVKGIDPEVGIEVTAYQIAKATYDETTGNFNGYESLYPTIITLPEEGGKVSITEEQLNEVIAATKVTAPITLEKAEGSDDYTATVAVGSYLVLVSKAETKVYSPMVASVNYVNETGTSDIEDGTVTTIADSNLWVKETGTPKVIKTQPMPELTEVADYSKNVGDTVPFTLEINPIPYYGGDHPVMNAVDTLGTGLTFNNDVKVTVEGTELTAGTDYTVTVDGQKVTINFVIDGTYTLNNLQGKKAVVSYSATVNTNAEFNETANINEVELNYTKDSKVEGRDGKDEDKTYTYTFDISDKLVKIDGTNEEPLAGAEFTLYTDEACENVYTNPLTPESKVYTTDATGKLAIKGLAVETYYLKETKAPGSYSVNTHVYKIEITATYYDAVTTVDGVTYDKGELKSWTVKVDGEAVTNDEAGVVVPFEIPNTKLSSLPSTGGIGTTIFTIGGCAIMIAAAFFFFASRRKETK